MSRINFTDEMSPAMQQRGSSFPKLWLKANEWARVCLLENPEQVWVHDLREPVLLNGKGVMKTKESKDGSTYEDWDQKFVASFQCLGDEETLYQNGVDVRNCPACDASTQFDRFRGPVPKYGLNVIKYNTKGNSAEVAKPFQVSTVVWVFGPAKFEEIRTLVQVGNYDLKRVDLVLGPCKNEGFQKFNIMVVEGAAWSQTEETQALTVETFKENRIEDLSKAISQMKDKAQVESLVNRVKRNWDILNGGAAMSNTDQILATVGSDNGARAMDTPSPGPTPEPATNANFEDLLKGLSAGIDL